MERGRIAGTAAWVILWIFLLFLPLSLRPASSLPDDGDALQATWMTGWVAHQLPRKPLDLFDANVFYPHPLGLAYSEHFIPQGIVIGLLQGLGCNLTLAYNLLAALTLLAIVLAVRWWAIEMGASDWGASVAGIACALSTFCLEEVARLHILSMQWIPLGLVFLWRYFRKGSMWAAVGFAICFVLQGLTSHYYLISLPLFLGPLAVGLVYFFPERRSWRDVLRLVLPLAVACLVFIPIELNYLKIFSQYRFRQLLPLGMDLARYVVPPPNSLVYGWFRTAAEGLQGSNQHFVGYLPLILAITGIVAVVRRNPDRNRSLLLWMGGLGVVFALLSAGKETWFGGMRLGPGLYRLLYDHVPFFSYARVPERLSVYFMLVFALFVGMGASALIRRVNTAGKRYLVLGCLFVLLPLEHARVPNRPYPMIPTPEQTPEVYHWLASRPGDFPVVEFPVYPRMYLRFYGYDNYFSTFHWKRIPFGRPSFYPPALEYLLWSLSDFPSRDATRLLQSMGVRLIVYHPRRDPHSTAVVRRLERDPNYMFVRRFPMAGPVAEELDYGEEVVFAVAPEAMPDAPADPALVNVPRESWRFATSSEEGARLAVDGNPETSWSSVRPQEKGQFFEIDFGEEIEVARISLGFIYPYSEFPRSLSVNGFHSSHRWRRLEFKEDAWDRARLVNRLVTDPASATLDLDLLEPMALERVRLFIRETNTDDAMPEWRIPEIWVFENSEPRTQNSRIE